MKMWINQWTAGIDGKAVHFFTPFRCEHLEALAIAVAICGEGVEWLRDDGHIRVNLTDAQIDGVPHRPPAVTA